MVVISKSVVAGQMIQIKLNYHFKGTKLQLNSLITLDVSLFFGWLHILWKSCDV